MSFDLDRCTERASQALAAVEEEARQRNHDYIGQEHLLAALVRVEDGLAARILAQLGVEPESVRQTVDRVVGHRIFSGAAQRRRTPRLERALDLAADEAEGFGHPLVGTDHLLLGMLREREGMGYLVLDLLRVKLNDARNVALSLRAAGETEP